MHFSKKNMENEKWRNNNNNNSISTISSASTSSTEKYHQKLFEEYNFWPGLYWTNAVTATPSLTSKKESSCVCVKHEWKEIVHGLCFALLTTNLALKIITFALVLVATVLSIVFTVSTIQNFFDAQTATRMTIKQKRDLRYPNITICPKNADSFNLSMIKEDISEYLPDLNETDAFNLVAFAVAGSGFDNIDTITKRWDSVYVEKLTTWFQQWESGRNLTNIFKFIHEDAGYKCSDLFIRCYYAGDAIPCCDIFRFAYVMLRGRCLKLREVYQEDPALTGMLTIFMRNITSHLIERGGAQLQTILYVSDEYTDVATFPRYYMSPRKWNQLHFARQVISMLPRSRDCSNSSESIGRGTCFVNTWLKRRVVNPFNCTLFYFQHKFPHLPVCRPEIIVKNLKNVVNLAFDNDTGCLPACFRRDTTMSLSITQVTPSLIQDVPNSVFQLEFAFDSLQEEMFQEVVTTTTPGFISEFGGQLGLFVGISATSFVQVLLYIAIFIFILTHNIMKYFSKKDKSL